MKKRNLFFFYSVLCLTIFFTVPLKVVAKDGISFSVAPLLSLPTGNSKELYSLGVGAGMELYLPLPVDNLSAFGQLNYQNLLLKASAGNLHTMLAGGGVDYLFLNKEFLSAHFKMGFGGYGAFFKDVTANYNPYFSAGLSGTLQLSQGFTLSLTPSYTNMITMRDGNLSSFYSGFNIGLMATLEPSSLGRGTRRAKLKIYPPTFYQVFPVVYKYYDENPIGTVIIRNEESKTIRNVSVEFYIPQYMDGPQEVMLIAELKSKEEIEIPITALLKNNVLSITERDSTQAQILVTYNEGNTSLTSNRNETLRIYDRNSINWDDDRKAAAFVTARDPNILKFSRNITSEIGRANTRSINPKLADALAIFEALRNYGLEYKIDPDSSYELLSQNDSLTDYLQFPVQTLDYRSGDCDDLSILYNSLLEAVSIETAFITTPGHIFPAFSLGISPAEASKIISNTENLIVFNNEAWVPVEITLLNDGFLKAWETGARQWREASSNNTQNFIPIREAWTTFEPSWFSSTESQTVIDRIPNSTSIVSSYNNSIDQFIQVQITPMVAQLQQRIAQVPSSRLTNQLGTLYARYGLLDKAQEEFQKAARQNYVPSLVNLGNIFFLKEEYAQANQFYTQAYKLNPENTDVLLALAKTGFEMEQYNKAKGFFDVAQVLDPEKASMFSYISGENRIEGASRASDARERKQILWSEE